MTRLEAKLQTNLTLYIEITRYLSETYIYDMYSSIRANEEISRNYHPLETILSQAATSSRRTYGVEKPRRIAIKTSGQ